MKKLFLIFLICASFASAKANAYADLKLKPVFDTAAYPFNQLSAINTSTYIGQPINTFLAALDNAVPGYVLSEVYGLDSRRLATHLTAFFKDGMAFTIVVKHTQYVQQFNADAQWDINQFRLETISRIEVHNGGTCYSGCLQH